MIVLYYLKFAVLLSGLLLLFLLPNWTESVDTVDISILARIINFFELNYKRVDANGHPRQYAVAINVPKRQCQQNFDPDHFLTRENAENVRNAITDETNGVYQGVELIAAGTRFRNRYNLHSESLLLNPPGNSSMSNLLNRIPDSCSIFYTFDSPCVDSCLNATRGHNILRALESWKNHSGIKAFVFKNIWKFDSDKDLETKFKQIVVNIPLYRCVSENQCYACNGEGNTTMDARCLTEINQILFSG
ncbi:uncharacterized protein LOC113114565 [Carassius auratus]|uniref:Uncharacterized protein LOC113114565 n=1 Tax=Carassius auratus TaxID=7957 RepID=A0A6P6QV53_CARAU|nr:uncharacterized protein LOC113114565 [Carassius auratus]